MIQEQSEIVTGEKSAHKLPILKNWYFAIFEDDAFGQSKQLKLVGQVVELLPDNYFLCNYYVDIELQILKFSRVISIQKLATYNLFPTGEILKEAVKHYYFY